MSRKSSKRAGRVVRYTLADGTVRTKHYPPYQAKQKASTGREVGDLLAAWQRSPKWNKLAENTRKQYTTYSRHLLAIEHTQVADVTRADLLVIRDAVIHTRGNGAGIAFARAASAAFGWARFYNWITHSPATELLSDLEHGHLPAWTDADFDMAMAHLPEHLRRPVVLAAYTGQRRGDLIAMEWSAFDGAKIRVMPEKTKKHRQGQMLSIPVAQELREELARWRTDISPSTILVNKFGRPWNTGTNLSKQLGEALSKIPGFPAGRNIHGLRKLAATRLAMAGCNMQEIAAITGHESLAMIQLYTRSVEQERAAESAMEKLRRHRSL